MNSPPRAWTRRAARLLSEPVVHFFAIAALLFLAHRVFVGDPRVIVVTAGVKADLQRRFQDANGRAPTGDELAAEVRKWEVDEALFREAQRDHLDRDDPGIRTILIDKMRLRASFALPKREPTPAELDTWLAAHRRDYQTPPRYDFELIAFAKAERGAAAARDALERALAQNKDPTTLGRPVIGGNLTVDDLKNRLEPGLAERIPGLAPGAGWQRVETARNDYLVRLKAVDDGTPTREKLGAQLVADWRRATQREAVDRALQGTIERYRFEEER